MNDRYSWSSVVVLAVIGLAAALAISVAVPIALRLALAQIGDARGVLLGPIVTLASALLAFAGVGISGLLGLQILRRDRAEGHAAEARAVAAALSGECRDLAAIFVARGDRLEELLNESQGDPITVKLNDVFPLPTVIYEAVAPKIGLLPVELANSTVVIYGRALGYKAQTDDTRSRQRWTNIVLRQRDIGVMFREHSNKLAHFAKLADQS